MASDDNVVRLKHLQPFANGISFPNGDNVVRLKHLVSLASAIADDSPSQQPALSIGSWSAVDTVYSADIFYDGDGTLSTDIGTISNGVLTVADDDGCFSGVISATTNFHFSLNTPALIDSFSISPNELTIDAGSSDTAEILITTSPPNSAYTLTAPNAPDWVSIDDTTLVFSPASTIATGDYEVTLHAETKDDAKNTQAVIKIEETQRITPTLSLTISNTTYQDTTRTATLTANTNNASGTPNWVWGAGTATITNGTNSKTKIIKGRYKDWAGDYYSFSKSGALTISAAGDYAESAIDFTLSGGYSDSTTKEPIKIERQIRRY